MLRLLVKSRASLECPHPRVALRDPACRVSTTDLSGNFGIDDKNLELTV
jgi:hypothetical protein